MSKPGITQSTLLRSYIIAGILWVACVGYAAEDTLIFNSGQTVPCELIQQSDEGITVRIGAGTMHLRTGQYKELKLAPRPPKDSAPDYLLNVKPGRLPSWFSVLASLTSQAWSSNITQIPATVINIGLLKNIPYQSYRCGGGFEVNVYGDLEDPAAIEIGIYPPLISVEKNKTDCVAFIQGSVLSRRIDRKILDLFELQKNAATINGLTIQISPETDEDSYGGWWVGVYDEERLDQIRATDAELAEITQDVNKPSENGDEANWTRAELATRKPTPPSAARSSPPPIYNPTPTTAARAATPTYQPSSGGTVYVRGYYRKDGTYVRPHTRRR